MPEQTTPIGFAVVGYGRIGKRHAALIGAHPEARLCAIVDVSEVDAPPGVPCFPSLEALLASPGAAAIDVVSIATPNGLHAIQACVCLEAGKHVMVEKPVALRSADIWAMLELAGRRGLRVFPVLQNRFAPGALWLKELVASGRLGAPYLVQVDCFWNRDQRYYQPGGWHGTADQDGGVLFTQFSHFVDLLYWLFGTPADIRSELVQGRHWRGDALADTGVVQFRWPGGALGCLNFSTAVWDKNMGSAITIIAENGSVKVGGQYLDSLDYYHVRGEAGTPWTTGPQQPDAAHRLMLASVVDALLGRGQPSIEAADAAEVIALIERMYKQ